MLYVELTDDQRAELQRVSRRAVGRVALRAQVVLLSDRRYRAPGRGVAGLEDAPRRGRPPGDPLARRSVDAQASQSPRCSGHPQSCWTAALLATFLAVRFGVTLSVATVRRHLKAHGWRWGRPRLAPASVLRDKRDPDAAGKEAAIAAALGAARRGAGGVLLLDECALHLLPVLRACWRKGPRPRVPTPGRNAKRAFFGALDAAGGTFHTPDFDRNLAVHFGTFLAQRAAAYPAGPLVLAMDNVQMHDAKVVRRWLAAHPRVTVSWLPRYAAHDANPVERIWGLMEGEVAANRAAGSLDALVVAARRFFATRTPPPVPASFLQQAA